MIFDINPVLELMLPPVLAEGNPGASKTFG